MCALAIPVTLMRWLLAAGCCWLTQDPLKYIELIYDQARCYAFCVPPPPHD